ncbi:aspartate/glutamate racemase family protein [Brevibacterium aurantiacum]|uniref:aspartate/glutamate racemase family protein n=1 Tax=Brevibacterium aurantiacum TaxID=273384 RepID=UPI001D00FC4A|nr:aspartate/glutamate racemase family protein [Brevibacterium aurantiacum]
MHKRAPAIEAAVDVPLIHIVDTIATVAKRHGYSTLLMLGTKWTVLDDFYAGRLESQGIHTLVPDEKTCIQVDQIIFDELTHGVFTDKTRARYVEVMNDLEARSADADAPEFHN